MSEPKHRLVITADGKAELLRDGATVWSSDDDVEFADYFGDDPLTPNNELHQTDVTDITAYLVDSDILPEGARLAVDYAEGIHLIEDEDGDDGDDGDDDELDPEWDDDQDDNTEARL